LTRKAAAKPVTVTQGYPTDIKRLAVKLTDEGMRCGEIREAIIAAHGKAPDSSNLARLIRQWRTQIE
jgi:hypothetical protein